MPWVSNSVLLVLLLLEKEPGSRPHIAVASRLHPLFLGFMSIVHLWSTKVPCRAACQGPSPVKSYHLAWLLRDHATHGSKHCARERLLDSALLRRICSHSILSLGQMAVLCVEQLQDLGWPLMPSQNTGHSRTSENGATPSP